MGKEEQIEERWKEDNRSRRKKLSFIELKGKQQYASQTERTGPRSLRGSKVLKRVDCSTRQIFPLTSRCHYIAYRPLSPTLRIGERNSETNICDYSQPYHFLSGRVNLVDREQIRDIRYKNHYRL